MFWLNSLQILNTFANIQRCLQPGKGEIYFLKKSRKTIASYYRPIYLRFFKIEILQKTPANAYFDLALGYLVDLKIFWK